ncbi:MAG: ABC transporter permease [Niastella sp.]|nr:ABC transporter permease [Niastella sp.]
MIRNILLVTWRNLTRNKAYTTINIVGLALGMAAFLLINAYNNFEKSYDRIHAGGERIYRVESQFYKGEDLTDDWATSTNGYARAMKDNLPGIETYVRINWHQAERMVRYNDIRYREEHACLVDSNFFTFFSYPLISGDPLTVLKEANTVVISESAAQRYFGKENPVGRFLDMSTQYSSLHCMVTGVFKDLPANSSLQLSMLISWATTTPWVKDFWYMHESYTFVKLQPGVAPASIEAQFPALAEKYKTGPSMKDQQWGIQLVPLQDIHLNAAKQYELEVKGSRQAVQLLNIMAFVILLIAFINYINLTTTKSLDRAREVGIRKINGARAPQLIFQFLLESFIINLAALVLAILLVTTASQWLPGFLNNIGAHGLLFDAALYTRTGIVLLTGMIVSGIYPAMILVRLKPITMLKGRFTFSPSGTLLRKSMVAFQFTASLLLIAGTIAVYRQLSYMYSQKIGTTIDQTIVIKAPAKTTNYAQKIQSIKHAFKAVPGVTQATASGAVPGKKVGKFLANRPYGASTTEERLYEMLSVDHDFIHAYGLEVMAGRAFDKNRPDDSTGLVMNEAAIRQFGFASPEAALNQQVWIETLTQRPNKIIGVIKNYHQQSLHEAYTPVILFMDRALSWIPADYFSVKVAAKDMTGSVAHLQKVWQEFFPESSFDYFFLDDFYHRQYQQDIQFGNNFILFSLVAIFIACMGLFGLTAYSTTRRTKEIGIRKVVGASVQHIVALLSWNTVKLILWCSLVAIPLAVFLTSQWLDGYAFRAPLTWWQFALPVAMLVLIALLTTAWLTIKAALANPTTSLRNE